MKINGYYGYATFHGGIETQAEIYHLCKLQEIECYLEVSFTRIGRLDAMIVINNKMIIIECKRENSEKLKIDTEQLERYKKLKLPIVLIGSPEYVKSIIELLKVKELKPKVYNYFSEKNELKSERLGYKKKKGKK